MRQGLKDTFSVPLIPERSQKRSRDSPKEPPEKVLTYSLQSKRVDFARFQGNAQLCIVASNSSDKTYGNLLRKVSEAAKCLINRHDKLAKANVRTVRKAFAVTADAATAAAAAVQDPTLKKCPMVDEDRADSASTTTYMSVPADNRNVTCPADTVPADESHADASGADQTAGCDEFIETFSIAAAVSAVDEATRRTTFLTRCLPRALNKASSAVGTASDSYALFFVLSGHIKTNHSSDVVRAYRTSDFTASFHFQANAIPTAIRAVDGLGDCIESGRRSLYENKCIHSTLTTPSKSTMAILFSARKLRRGRISVCLRHHAHSKICGLP